MVALAAERHAGRLDIVSAPGQGSRFTLRLPLQQPAPAPAPFPTALPESARPAPLRLLVVDDDAAVREAIATQLRLDGHEVVEAASGRQALALLRAALGRGRPPHAVLSDMGMPDLDGRELARAVKALAPSLPVLMITGWGRGLADDALPAGVDMLLAKPLRLHELRAALLRASPPPPAPPPPE
jgi:CheY-like chemotaxis protein